VTIGIHSQENWIVGTGPTLELNENLVGVNLRAYYGPNEQFCFGPEVSFFPYSDVSEEEEVSIIDLNFNAHYIFEVGERIGIYPLSGINHSIENTRLIEDTQVKENINAFGINYGAGIHYNLNKLFVFTEYKGIIGELNAPFITAGIIFNFSFKKEE
jgi:hypothetical protein